MLERLNRVLYPDQNITMQTDQKNRKQRKNEYYF